MTLENQWMFKRIHGSSLSLKTEQLKKVKPFKNPFETVSLEDSQQKILPRVARKLNKIKALESEMKRKREGDRYSGLIEDQAIVIERVVSQDKNVRKKMIARLNGILQSDDSKNKMTETNSNNELNGSNGSIPDFDIIEYSSAADAASDEKKVLKSARVSVVDMEKTESTKPLKEKYAKFMDKKRLASPRTKKEALKKKDMNLQALEEMKQTTLDLQTWAIDILGKPVQLIEDLDPDKPDPDRPLSLLPHEIVDVGGIDVLLNACKPTLLDTKAPIRLNVVQEANPPQTLVKNIQKTMGIRIKSSRGQGKTLKYKIPVESSFTWKPKEPRKRPNYGHWYVKPKLWNHHMLFANDQNSNKSKKEGEGLRGLVQKKLDHIRAEREREDAEILAALEAKSNRKYGGKK